MTMIENKVADFSKKRGRIKTSKKLLTNEGFTYIVINKDVNGFDFNKEHLKKYAMNNKYTITVAQDDNGKTVLRNYFVDNNDIMRFFKLFQEEKIKGEIIEIDKFDSGILA